MGSYIEENLARDEQIIIKAQVTWLSQFWYLLFGILFILSSFGSKSLVGVVVGGVWFFKCAGDFNLRGTTSRAQPNELLGLCICRTWPRCNLSISLSA